VLDCHDREVIGWRATTAGISGEMIRDMMIECVERRFQAPYRVQWLTDNGFLYPPRARFNGGALHAPTRPNRLIRRQPD
jgi:transposase InsO family protein